MSPASDDDQNLPSNLEHIQAIVQEFLKRRVHLFSITTSSRGVELHGYCDSFHTKQMAQEIVSQNTRLRIVGNHLVVMYSSRTVFFDDSHDVRKSED